MKSGADTFILTSEHLPVTGEAHPLRARYGRYFLWAACIAAAMHIAVFGGWLLGRTLKPEQTRAPVVKVVKIADLGVPPSLTQREAAPQVNIEAAVAPPSIGVPEPVPDFQAPNLTMASQEEMAAALAPTDLSSLEAGGVDSIVIDLGSEGDQSPSPEDFVAVDEMPVLITMPTPLYPDMARRADVEGTVFVRALIGKDGKVKQAFVTEGVTLLNDAAIEAAKKAVFKPALQQHRPVEVWVQIPMRFRLRG
jgi:protein TonB